MRKNRESRSLEDCLIIMEHEEGWRDGKAYELELGRWTAGIGFSFGWSRMWNRLEGTRRWNEQSFFFLLSFLIFFLILESAACLG